jgi:GxxExxY protein
MNTDKNNAALTGKVIGAVFEVSNTLGAGFLEKVYERALMRELQLRGIRAQSQVPLTVSYKGQEVGQYIADLVVEDELIVELKCVKELATDHMAQCLNYLKASGRELCLLVNFQGNKAEYKRVVNSVQWDLRRY